MRVPEVQARLKEIVVELSELADELSRRKPVMRGDATSKPMTSAMKQAVRDLHNERPNMSQMDIARTLGINIGRVSETLAGKRE